MKVLNWKIEVIFIEDYERNFDENELDEKKDSQNRFELAIIETIKQTEIVPEIDDWIEPLAKPDYLLDIGRIAGRNFYPGEQKIVFEIE